MGTIIIAKKDYSGQGMACRYPGSAYALLKTGEIARTVIEF
jgi:hypothetical protein